MMVFITLYHRQNYSVKYTEYWNAVVLLEELCIKNKETNTFKVKKKYTFISAFTKHGIHVQILNSLVHRGYSVKMKNENT